MITSHHQEYMGRWLCERIGLEPTAHLCCIGSVNKAGDTLRGVVGYDSFNGASVVMHMAGDPGWIDKSVLLACFDYPFNVMGCDQVLAFVPSGNETALSINKRLGFQIVVELEGAHPDGSLFVMRMKRDNCKWLVPRRTH